MQSKCIDLIGTDFCHQYIFEWKLVFDLQLSKAHESLLMDADVLLSMWRVSMSDIKELKWTPSSQRKGKKERRRRPTGTAVVVEHYLVCIYLLVYFFTKNALTSAREKINK